ncbi:Smr/MutS family protein [Paremcibacter congregatus]|uniref:Smr domain-containing protein n=1 Tax=Paremcibacter congregatus TaxID=2043170 RepID=A0A2G4YPK4_9PROT|nr:Smr/MutS family protein [Paremcibacter congregatus]PHZ84254.1 hypothetical protein CRD36_13775 [Paremcibacter congregatus]QDE29011.1 hypothetical protein FIV45_17895 [Paremcibacter congregatus]
MTGKKKKDGLSPEDAQLWQRVTENISRMESNRAARPQLRRTAYPLINTRETGFDYGNNHRFLTAPELDLTEMSFTVAPGSSFALKDADHNWRQRLRRGKVKPEGKIDLHGMTQDKAYAVLSRYILEAQQRGKRFILVITGKGGRGDQMNNSRADYDRERGVLKTNVPRWLSQGDLSRHVVSYYAANREHGGDGALYVVLKRQRG